jgi:hypothetical protein
MKEKGRNKYIQEIIYAMATILEYECLPSCINNWLSQIENYIENPASLRSSYCGLVLMWEVFSPSHNSQPLNRVRPVHRWRNGVEHAKKLKTDLKNEQTVIPDGDPTRR